MFHPVRGSSCGGRPLIYRKSYRIAQKLIWWPVSKRFRRSLSCHDDPFHVRENFVARKSHETVSSISRTHRDRSAKRILWFNFPSVATRNSSVRDLRIRMAVGQTWNARNYTPSLYSLSLSLRPYRWKMFYDQTLRSPFKQHIADATTAESSNDRTWQNIVAKPSSCICFSLHFCLCNWFIAIVAWKLGRAKCFTTVFPAKPPRTKLGRL